MFVALYSETARRDVVAARAFIAERGYGSGIEDIRAPRRDDDHADGSPLRNVAFFNDFFTTSECRDLLFHVQEHRMTCRRSGTSRRERADVPRLRGGFPSRAALRGAFPGRQGDDRSRSVARVRAGIAPIRLPACIASGCRNRLEDTTMLTKDDIEALSAGADDRPKRCSRRSRRSRRTRVDAGPRHRDAPSRRGAAGRAALFVRTRRAYPVGGRKQKRDTGWSRKVLAEHQVLLSAGDDGIRESFEDHAIIFGLGLHSCVNVPLVSQGQCVGTLNVLRAQADWNADQIAVARALGLAALAGVLMMRG
jgi:hypothetical protein